MHIFKLIKKIDRVGLTILLVHTLVMSYFVYTDLFPANADAERWVFFFPFFIDFPISIAFHQGGGIIGDLINALFNTEIGHDIGAYTIVFFHIVFGALWWLVIWLVFKKVTLKVLEKSA